MPDEKAEVEELETEEIEVEAEDQEAPTDQTDETEGETPDDEPEDEETVVVTFGDEESPPQETEPAPEWVKDLRKKSREDKRRIKELEAKLEERTGAVKAAELGPKPTLASVDYDEDKLAEQLLAWNARKQDAEAEKAKKEEAEKKATEDWQNRLDFYAERKKALKAPDIEDLEADLMETLSQTQQGIIVQGMDDPALVVLALGRNPEKAKALAAITDPVKFAVAAAKLETTLKVSRQQKPTPERKVGGTGRMSGAMDRKLEQLEAEADRTGDRSKVIAYKRRQRDSATT